jgi:hypothetical protein
MIVATLALALTVGGQDMNSPVTFGEVKDVFHQVQEAMAKSVHEPVGAFAGLADSSKPASREVIIDEFDRLSHLYESAYVIKPRTQLIKPSLIKLAGPEKSRATRLIKLGFLAPVSQLVVGPSDTLGPLQFGMDVAFFIERFADMTHTPSIKWSPYLENDESGPPTPQTRAKPGA